MCGVNVFERVQTCSNMIDRVRTGSCVGVRAREGSFRLA